MRLFFAVSLRQQAEEAVAALQQRLADQFRDPGLRWVKREQLHYTLKFLGEVDEALVQDCCASADRVLQGEPPFLLELHGIGGFPGARAPRVVWLGASAGAGRLTDIAAALDRSLSAVGFSPEARPFSPHLTIARVKGPSAERAASRLLQSERVEAVASTVVDSVVLMRSQLSPKGATYTAVRQFSLGHAH